MGRGWWRRTKSAKLTGERKDTERKAAAWQYGKVESSLVLASIEKWNTEKPRPKFNRVPNPWDYTMSQEARLAPNVTRMVCAEAEQARTAEVESRSLQSTARAKQT